MLNKPIFSEATFSVGQYQLSTIIHQDILKIKATLAHKQSNSPIQLKKFIVDEDTFEIWVSTTPQIYPTGKEVKSAAGSFYQTNKSFESLQAERIDKLENHMKSLEAKILESQQKQRLSESRQYHNNSRNLTALSGEVMREEGEFVQMIQKEAQQNAKLELLNGLLQEKLLQKEGNLYQFEKRILEREDLIRELAEKLITANQEKEDIFNQYEKILQNTVFHHLEDNSAQHENLKEIPIVKGQIVEQFKAKQDQLNDEMEGEGQKNGIHQQEQKQVQIEE